MKTLTVLLDLVADMSPATYYRCFFSLAGHNNLEEKKSKTKIIKKCIQIRAVSYLKRPGQICTCISMCVFMYVYVYTLRRENVTRTVLLKHIMFVLLWFSEFVSDSVTQIVVIVGSS